MSHQHYLTTLLVICLLLPSLPANATLLTHQTEPLVLAKSGGLTLEQAAAEIRHQTGGRILSATESHDDGHKIYRIKVLLPSGHVRVITINADGS